MEQGPVGTTEECFAVGAEEMVAHSEEVVTSSETVVEAPAIQPQPLPQPLPQTPSQPTQIYNIPTLIASPGPVMQVVTLQTIQQPTTPQVGLTNTLRNIRLIAIQPKLPLNGTNGRPISLQSSNKPDIKIQPQPSDASKKVAVNSFYSKLKPSQPVTLAPKQPQWNKQPPPQQHVVKPSPSFYKEQQREREMKEFSHLNEELQRGLRIFLDLTTSLHHNTTWPFMERVDPVKDGAPDYDDVIKKPMWLSLVKEKFRKNQYSCLSDFVSDMRLIMENCYRYNGPNHPVTKKALRLEQSLEQKLALLPSDLRTKCALVEAESERKARPGSSESYFSVLLHRVKHEREQREQLAREKKVEEQRLRREEKERQRCLWAERMMNPEVKSQMRTMWEIPQIGHFLHLARGALHIGEIAQYELEHMFLMPEASVLLATLMTSLLSSPNQRVKLAESPPTPYAVWSARVGNRVAEWYRTYNREGRQFVKLHELLGLEPMFWRVCGDTNPLEGGKLSYHQLSFLKRVWIFKGLCDTVAHSHKTVQEAMAEEEGPESRQVTLGQDANGYTYLHFPAVSGSDIRVYRQKSWDLESDPIWGPIAEERREAEELRAREEELKAAELRKRKRASTANNKRLSTTPARKTTTPAKKKQSVRSPRVSTPATQKKRSAIEERPSRIGTRVSPRTLQRQTGLTLYKDTSSESEDEESNEEAASDGSVDGQDPVDSVTAEEDEEKEEAAVVEPVVAVANKAAAQRKRRGRKPKSRKRPVKKKLPKIAEEAETDANADVEMKEPTETKETEPDDSIVKETANENDEAKLDEENEDKSDDVKIKDEPTAQDDVSIKAENGPDDELNESKPSPLTNGDSESKADADEEMPSADSKVEDTKESEIKQEDTKEEQTQSLVKTEEAEEAGSTGTTQRFTVSQLLQKLAPAEETNDSQSPTTEASTEVPAAAELDSKPDTTLDPDRASYDPFFFELIISSVEELQEWIDKFTDSNEGRSKARPRCEIKLRERLQSLLEEAQPLAADQQQANQKISQQLWKEWESYRCSSSGDKNRSAGADQLEQDHDFARTESDSEQGESDDSLESNDGVRHSRRLRVKRNRNNVVNGSTQSTRSSSPAEEEPVTKQSRKSSYHFDPEWETEASPEASAQRKRSSYVPEMKNPGFWVGRRVTRATAAYVDVAEDSTTTSPSETPQSQEQTGTPAENSPKSGVQSAQLIDQLRQLRRQQVLLSSNDPRPGGSATTTTTPIRNGSPNVYMPSKDGQMVRISNPRTAELLSKFRMVRPAKLPGSPAAPPPKILIQQRPPQHLQQTAGGVPVTPKSIDITHVVSQAAEKGLIVAHEARRISINMGEHGHFLVTAQMTPSGPKVICASPVSKKLKSAIDSLSSTPAASPAVATVPVAPVPLAPAPLAPVSGAPVPVAPAPVATTPAAPVPVAATEASSLAESTSSIADANSSSPSVPANPTAPTDTAVPSTPSVPAVEPIALPVSTAEVTDAEASSTPLEPASIASSSVTDQSSSLSQTPSTDDSPTSNGSPVISKQVLVNDPRQNNILSADILCSVAGPDAVGAKLTIVKEGNTKMLTLILSNGETRRLTNSQVLQIQAAVRNKTKPSSEAS